MPENDIKGTKFQDEDFTESRKRVPRYGADLVGAPALNLSKFAAPLVAAVGVIVTGLAPVFGIGDFPKFADLHDDVAKALLALGFTLVVATAIAGVTIAFAADMKTRGLVTAASLHLRQQDGHDQHVILAPPGAPGNSAGLWVKRKGRGDDEQFLVVAAHRSQAGVTEYLLTRGDDAPDWVPAGDVTAWEVQASRPPLK